MQKEISLVLQSHVHIMFVTTLIIRARSHLDGKAESGKIVANQKPRSK